MQQLPTLTLVEPHLDPSSSIKKLCAAVVARAIRDLFVINSDAGQAAGQLNRESRSWIGSPRTTILSFIWCCKVIGFCPNAMRSAIKRLEKSPELLGDLTDELGRGLARKHRKAREAMI